MQLVMVELLKKDAPADFTMNGRIFFCFFAGVFVMRDVFAMRVVLPCGMYHEPGF
jgi:hypothetical protein